MGHRLRLYTKVLREIERRDGSMGELLYHNKGHMVYRYIYI